MARLGDLFPDDLQQLAGIKPAAPPIAPPRAHAAAQARPVIERTCVKDFVAGQDLEGIYLVVEAAIRAAKNGSKYIQATFCDRTGTIPVRQWDANDHVFAEYKQGGYVKVRGRVEFYKSAMQMIVFAVQCADGEKINPADFIPVSTRPLDEMERELDALVETFADPDYKRLLQAIFSDSEVKAKFIKGPAAASVHHAWCGGLIEHVLSACKTAQSIAEQRPFLNRDLLLAGVILHDIGKIEEIDPGPGFSYTDTGRLCGHIVLGTLLVERFITKLENFPKKKRDLLLHMILSHHGTHEFGSPVTPATMEAVALHHLECLDAKVQGIQSIIERERAAGNDSTWSEFARVVDGRIYKA
jgi:3'-5' exoribonuclease